MKLKIVIPAAVVVIAAGAGTAFVVLSSGSTDYAAACRVDITHRVETYIVTGKTVPTAADSPCNHVSDAERSQISDGVISAHYQDVQSSALLHAFAH